MIDQTFSAYGRLDFAFNNAGIEGISANTQDCTQENWERTIAINLTGVWSVIWLCSDAASFITGHALPVDGGWIAS